jgi:hypothetical protein
MRWVWVLAAVSTLFGVLWWNSYPQWRGPAYSALVAAALLLWSDEK